MHSRVTGSIFIFIFFKFLIPRYMRASEEDVDLALNGDSFIQPVRKVKKLIQKMPPSTKKTQVEMWPKKISKCFFF